MISSAATAFVLDFNMTICMLTYSFYEGDTRVMRYAEALAKRGDRVDVIALRRDEQSTEGSCQWCQGLSYSAAFAK